MNKTRKHGTGNMEPVQNNCSFEIKSSNEDYFVLLLLIYL